jgi:GNAT superfamily N-acetyltransferase
MGPSASIALRAAEHRDADAVAALLAVLGYPCSREDAEQRIDDIADEPDQYLRVAELDGEVCGLLALDVMYYLPLGSNTARITALAVGRAQSGRGIGRALLQEAELLARQAGAARIEVTSAAHRDDAHAFYQACGYSDSPRRYLKHLGTA